MKKTTAPFDKRQRNDTAINIKNKPLNPGQKRLYNDTIVFGSKLPRQFRSLYRKAMLLHRLGLPVSATIDIGKIDPYEARIIVPPDKFFYRESGIP